MLDDEKGDDAISRATEESIEDANEALDEMDPRLDDLEARAAKARGRLNASRPTPGDSSISGGVVGSGKSLGVGLTIAYGMIGTPIVFFFIGKLIDGASGETRWQTGLGAFGALLGFLWIFIVLRREQAG